MEQGTNAQNPITDRQQVRGAAMVGVAMTFANICAYLFVVAAARVLSPGAYGEVGAVTGLLLVTSVVQMGLQTNAARTIATAAPETDRAALHRRTIRSGLRAAGLLLIIGVTLAPLLAWVLNLTTWLTMAFAAFAAAELAMTGAITGLLQGERRWMSFAKVQALAGLGRLVVAGGMVFAMPTAAGAALGIAVGTLAPLGAALWIASRMQRDGSTQTAQDSQAIPLDQRHKPDQQDQQNLQEHERDTAGQDGHRPEAHSRAEQLAERVNGSGLGLWSVLRDSHLLLALLVLSNLDVLLARVVLDGHSSGVYAAGLIVAKAVLFLPQFVITVAFPDMVDSTSRKALQVTLIAVVAIGAVTTAAIAVLREPAVMFVGGDEYRDVADHLWKFALLGTALSLVNVYVYRFLATARRHVEWAVWALVAAVGLGSLAVHTPGGLVALMITADVVLLAVLAFLERHDRSGRSGSDEAAAKPRRALAGSS